MYETLYYHNNKRMQVKQRGKQGFFRLGSRFIPRGGTEYEAVHRRAPISRLGSSTSFERRPSQRYNARQSHLNRQREVRDLLLCRCTSQLVFSFASSSSARHKRVCCKDKVKRQVHKQRHG